MAASCFSLNVLFVGLIGLLLAAAHLPLHVLCTASFSMELMHRDHPESPLHNTASAASRADYFHSADSRNHSFPLVPEVPDPYAMLNNFVVNLKLGEPGIDVTLGISLTGLSWVLCTPCEHCHNTTQSIFNQGQSGSYLGMNCQYKICKDSGGKCDGLRNCKFQENFNNDNIGYAIGFLAYERMGLSSPNGELYLDNMIFGCTHRTQGRFYNDVIGILGLGYTTPSFVIQIRRHSIQNMFSYCLPLSIDRSSLLIFGASAYVPGASPYLSTPMDTSNNMYRVSVKDANIFGGSVENMMPINIHPKAIFVMDFAYKFTYMDEWLLDMIISIVKSHTPFPPVLIDTNHKLCFNVSTGWREDQMPKIALIFVGGAEYVLEPVNAFEIVKEDALCLTILSNERVGKSIIGRNAQYQKRLVFDLKEKKLAFLPRISC